MTEGIEFLLTQKSLTNILRLLQFLQYSFITEHDYNSNRNQKIGERKLYLSVYLNPVQKVLLYFHYFFFLDYRL